MSDSNSTGNASIAEPPFRFLALPGEIRNQVYECVVANFESDRLRHTRSVREVLRHLPVPIWAFLLTCKQIRAELLEHCYRSYVWLANLRITTKGFEPFELNGDRSWMLQPEDEWMPPAGALSKVCIRLYYRLPKGEPSPDQTFWMWQNELSNRIVSSIGVNLLDSRLDPPFQVRVQNEVDPRISNWPALGSFLAMELRATTENKLAGIMAEKRTKNEGVTAFSVEDWRGVVRTLRCAFLNFWSTRG